MLLLKKIEDVLASMDIKDATPEKILSSDLSMDSQELLCAILELEGAFGVEIGSGDLSRNMSVLDVARIISCKQALKSRTGQFDHDLCEDLMINVPMEAAYAALYDVDTWPRKLPHVRAIKKQYDDGVFQEFDMEIDGANGSVISVHSVRRCEPGRIKFFQPSPPRFLRHHCGEWILHPMSEDLTHVFTSHQWRLADAATEMFPEEEGITTATSVKSWLTEHARFALTCWKSYLEEKQSYEKDSYSRETDTSESRASL
jgi:acyl carrier protein